MRVFRGWSRRAATHRARKEPALRQVGERRCRVALGLWRLRLAQKREVERRDQERAWRRARWVLQIWHSCWQRAQILHWRWMQGHSLKVVRAAFYSRHRQVVQKRSAASRQERYLLHRNLPQDQGELGTGGNGQGGSGGWWETRKGPVWILCVD
ncbi:uncharacterized protein C1orf167-like [Ornithorhynchus anatinus]|uniref:uncharacterized protein C1orf167-like n=1 Tax=Ornithorhynchus anatinus TaxID=9258 RepID=UPI0019D4AFDA|nr:uncharacterized protein C1orf167-like [Ornithorhynchus anatinus]